MMAFLGSPKSVLTPAVPLPGDGLSDGSAMVVFLHGICIYPYGIGLTRYLGVMPAILSLASIKRSLLQTPGVKYVLDMTNSLEKSRKSLSGTYAATGKLKIRNTGASSPYPLTTSRNRSRLNSSSSNGRFRILCGSTSSDASMISSTIT